MSDTLRIAFDNDMPVAAVDVVAPDFRVVARTMLSAGRSKDIDVPSGLAFLRVHLPDGRVVTLDDPGNLKRIISKSSLAGKVSASAKSIMEIELAVEEIPDRLESVIETFDEAAGGGEMIAFMEDDEDDERRRRREKRARASRRRKPEQIRGEAPLPLNDAKVRVLGSNDVVGTSRRSGKEVKWTMDTRATNPPLELQYDGGSGSGISIKLPATTLDATIRHQSVRGSAGIVRVTLSTQSPHADAILSYLIQGDMYSAQALAEWADEAEQMVYRDDSDPYSGVVGAYLLLRLRQFERMRDWPQVIADRFRFLPDGCVIWAWQLLQQSRGAKTKARDYLFEASSRGLPVYSEGLRLLIDGLCLFGKDGEKERDRVLERASNVVWTSPLTALLTFGDEPSTQQPPTLEVSFAS